VPVLARRFPPATSAPVFVAGVPPSASLVEKPRGGPREFPEVEMIGNGSRTCKVPISPWARTASHSSVVRHNLMNAADACPPTRRAGETPSLPDEQTWYDRARSGCTASVAHCCERPATPMTAAHSARCHARTEILPRRVSRNTRNGPSAAGCDERAEHVTCIGSGATTFVVRIGIAKNPAQRG